MVPVWALYYFPRSNRPFGAWPLQRCLRVRWSRHISTVVAKCEIDYLGRNLDVPLVSEFGEIVAGPKSVQDFRCTRSVLVCRGIGARMERGMIMDID